MKRRMRAGPGRASAGAVPPAAGGAEGEGAVAGQAVERSQHDVRHVIRQHPGADQDAPERYLGGPLRPVPDLGEAGPGGTKQSSESCPCLKNRTLIHL